MIEDADIGQSQCVNNPLGDDAVSLAWFRHPGRKIVRRDDGGGIEGVSALHNLAGTDSCSVDLNVPRSSGHLRPMICPKARKRNQAESREALAGILV